MGTHFLLTGFSTQQVAPHEINIIARYLFQMEIVPLNQLRRGLK
jgi:hypothetical protein